MLTMSRLSREFVFLDVTTSHDLTLSTSEVAFIADPLAPPDPADWLPADLLNNEGWVVRKLVGPGHVDSTELSAGDYQVWVRINDNPEAPVRRVGTLGVE